MESGRMQRRYAMVEHPLSPRDYDMPIGWWGWNWEPPVPMSITEILQAGNMDPRTAAVCGMAIEAHSSLLIAAEQPHSGKTTTLTALLDFLPNATRRIFVRGWAETFDFIGQTRPADTILLANELSSHLPVYLWGPKAVRVFEMLRRGYALGSTLHADSANEALAQLVGELGVDRSDLARVHLLMVMRIYGTAHGGYARRVVSLDRLVPNDGSVATIPRATRSWPIWSRAAIGRSRKSAPRWPRTVANPSPISSEEIQSNDRPTDDRGRPSRNGLPHADREGGAAHEPHHRAGGEASAVPGHRRL